jgi:CHAD domain-containing protein
MTPAASARDPDERRSHVPTIRSIGTVRDLVRRSIAKPTNRLVSVEPAVMAGDDLEAVHAARVAIRRLRSDLKMLAPTLDGETTDALRTELGWLAEQLAPVRDADVLRDRFRRRIAGSGLELAAARVLLDELERERSDAHHRLIEAMGSPRYAATIDRLVEAGSSPPVRPGDADRPARSLGSLMDAPWASLSRRARKLGEGSSDASLHAVRIRAKRVRYASEALAPVFGKAASRFAAAAERLQDRLGDHQDAVVAVGWLSSHAVGSDDPGVAFAAGRLAEQEAADRRRARERWPRAWDRLRAREPFWT